MFLMVDAGYASQREVAVTFGCSERTVADNSRRPVSVHLDFVSTDCFASRGRTIRDP
jgi:hypothetical protein